ncbi:MAG: tripartite tricarboxylate transporter substrate-binding protein, partial [Beijerinckiaceae bacterium]|nr:tripartite tricarboxylate transporter substrate-binding protein [Beijerinckiaceae bacterium]
LARFIGKYIPGNPTVVVNNMPGASGLVAFNWLANIAPKNGTIIATGSFSVPFEPVFGNKRARFDATKLGWVGNMDSSVSVCAVRTDSGINSFDDMLTKTVMIGGTGKAGPISQSPMALKNLLGAKINLIEGYKGTASVKLAIERKEVQGICGVSFSTVRTQYKSLLQENKIRIVLQLGTRPKMHPLLRKVPHVYAYARDEAMKQQFDLIFGVQSLGSSFATTPGVPPRRLRALREAYIAAINDKGLRAEARKIDLDINPQWGEDVQSFVAKAYKTPPETVAKAASALGR